MLIPMGNFILSHSHMNLSRTKAIALLIGKEEQEVVSGLRGKTPMAERRQDRENSRASDEHVMSAVNKR